MGTHDAVQRGQITRVESCCISVPVLNSIIVPRRPVALILGSPLMIRRPIGTRNVYDGIVNSVLAENYESLTRVQQ